MLECKCEVLGCVGVEFVEADSVRLCQHYRVGVKEYDCGKGKAGAGGGGSGFHISHTQKWMSPINLGMSGSEIIICATSKAVYLAFVYFLVN